MLIIGTTHTRDGNNRDRDADDHVEVLDDDDDADADDDERNAHLRYRLTRAYNVVITMIPMMYDHHVWHRSRSDDMVRAIHIDSPAMIHATCPRMIMMVMVAMD